MPSGSNEITIQADGAHCTLQQPDDVDAPPYLIPPTLRLILDVFGYELLCSAAMQPLDEGKLAVHVAHHGGYYFAKWPIGQTKFTLDVDSLVPALGYPDFAGFQLGQYMVVVGLEKYREKEIEFFPLWFGEVDVEAMH